MNTEKRDFNREAATWDENPARVKLADDVAHAISKQIILTPEMDVMDFGCGTGLLALRLQPLVHSVTGVDSSQGMLDIFNAKIAKLKLDRVKTLLADLDKGDLLTGNYDLVLSNMTLHHIKEIEPLFAQFHKVTASGGYLCIADLDLDGGQFHEDNTGVFHFGFDRAALQEVFTKAGFVDVRNISAAEMVKPSNSGELKRFSIFLMVGRKRSD
ncbi:Ubiquinone/menaquinone biosynthesis C-methyltransferase UbiE [uncultured archaeon]|nr:Ubiquinone/menaquinone biosynthesis C-methyltransferase UbiE [uncultured archaeon]